MVVYLPQRILRRVARERASKAKAELDKLKLLADGAPARAGSSSRASTP